MTPRAWARFIGAALATVLLAPPVRAQAPATFWYGASLGAASARFTCDPCADARDGGPAIRLAAGAYARPGLRVGVTVGGWTHGAEELRETVRHAGVIAALAVRPGSPLHLLGGLGWIGWRSEPFSYDALDVSVGAGWELPVAGRWALSTSGLLQAASFGHLRTGDENAVDDVSLSLARVEIGVTRR